MSISDTPDRLSVDALAPGLLAHLGGRAPPAPSWFEAAMRRAPEVLSVEAEAAAIEVLVWGEHGRPGLLLLHGNGAHAGWWRPLAPFFADRYRVAAMSWSGMGGSDWRPRYSAAQFAREAMAVIAAAGLEAHAEKPLVAAHSFGGFIALHMAQAFGDRLKGVATLDARIAPPSADHDGPPRRSRPNRVYPTFEEALARFRLAPPQPCENLYYIDAIGRESLRQAPLPDGEGKGWTWKFDPFVMSQFDFLDLTHLYRDLRCPIAQAWGDRSQLVTPQVARYMQDGAPPGSPAIVIPDADHHVMLDQPLATVAAMNGLFSAWP